jgi:hypothetical protein
MTAQSCTDWLVRCNGPQCQAQRWASELLGRDLTAKDVRKSLRRQGWAVALPNPQGGAQQGRGLLPGAQTGKYLTPVKPCG